MTRRRLFGWLARAVGTASAAVVGIPAVRYLIDPLKKRPSPEFDFKRVARLFDLPTGVPKELAVRDVRRDAWTVYPEEMIGRVWLVRRSDDSVAPESSRVDGYTTACPHLGCAVQLDPAGKKFVCPCHKAGFRLNGERLNEKELGHKNPAPRDLDSLDSQVVQDEETGHWWVEVRYQKFRHGPTTKIAVT